MTIDHASRLRAIARAKDTISDAAAVMAAAVADGWTVAQVARLTGYTEGGVRKATGVREALASSASRSTPYTTPEEHQ